MTYVISHLFIVSRLEPDLYDYLSREFAGEEEVQVIYDRRQGERRRGARQPDVERRQRDRRAPSHVSRQISSLGYAFVRLDG